MYLEPGTWEDAESLVGTVIAEQVGADPVNAPMVRQYLESLEWDSAAWNDPGEGLAPMAPSAMYMTFGMPAYWGPGDPPLPDGSLAPFPFGRVPAPGSTMMATQTDVTFAAPLRDGDRLHATWRLVGVTRKTLAIGDGAFLDFETTYRNQADEVVAVERTSTFRYEPVTPDDE